MTTFSFKELEEKNLEVAGRYTEGCSGNRSDCCTRTCTNDCSNQCCDNEESTLKAWDQYLKVEAGVLQY